MILVKTFETSQLQVAVAFCLQIIPLWKSTKNRPVATSSSPPMNVNVQPIPIALIMFWRKETAIAAKEQRTRLLEAWAAAGVSKFLSTRRVLYIYNVMLNNDSMKFER